MPPDRFVYHRRPVEFHGSVILPLNQLISAHPDAHASAVQKYDGRRRLMEARIPLLDCLWNDAVHLAPVNPRLIYRALTAAGAGPEPDVLFFRIPAYRVAEHPAVQLDFSSRDGVTLDVHAVEPFRLETYRELDELPSETVEYYGREVRAGRRPLLFARIPHVLVAGPVDVGDVDLVAWDS